MFLSPPGERNSSSPDNKSPVRSNQGSSKLVVGTPPISDENLQNYRIQIAVNRYNNTNVPPFRQYPMSVYRCSAIRSKSSQLNLKQSEESGEATERTHGASYRTPRLYHACEEGIKSAASLQCKGGSFSQLPRQGPYRTRLIMKQLSPQNPPLSLQRKDGSYVQEAMTPELRYTGPEQFPTCHINKSTRQPLKKQNILSLLNAHGTGLPVSRYMDDSAEKYSDLKSTRSVLDVLQDMSRKRMHGNDDIDEGPKRRCNGLGGDLVQDGEVLYKPLFVPKTRHPTLPRKDQCTQTAELFKDNVDEASLSTYDLKDELRKKLARKNNAISASLSSSARGFVFAARKRAVEETSSEDVTLNGSSTSKKSRVRETSSLSPPLEDAKNKQRNDKMNVIQTSPKSPQSQDRFMSIYLDLQNAKDAKLIAIKTLNSSPGGNQFVRPEASSPAEGKLENSGSFKIIATPTSSINNVKEPSNLPATSTNSFTFLTSKTSAKPDGFPPSTSPADGKTSVNKKEEKLSALTTVSTPLTPGFTFMTSPVSNAVPTTTSAISPSLSTSKLTVSTSTSVISSLPILPSSPSSVTSVTTSIAAPVVTAVPQDKSTSLPQFNISGEFKFSPAVSQAPTSSPVPGFSFKPSTPTTVTHSFSLGQMTPTTTSSSPSADKAGMFTFVNTKKDQTTPATTSSETILNNLSSTFKFENPSKPSAVPFCFGLANASQSNSTSASSELISNNQPKPVSSSTSSAMVAPTFSFGSNKKDELHDASSTATTTALNMPAPLFSFGQKSSEPTNVFFGGKNALGSAGNEAVKPTSSENVTSKPASSAESTKTDSNSTLKWSFSGTSSSDQSKPLFGQASPANTASTFDPSKPLFRQPASSNPSSFDSTKPVFGNPTSNASSTTLVANPIFGQSASVTPSSAFDASKPVFGNSATNVSSTSDVVKPVFGSTASPTLAALTASKPFGQLSGSNASTSLDGSKTIFGQPVTSSMSAATEPKKVESIPAGTEHKPLSVFSRLGDPPSSSPFTFGKSSSANTTSDGLSTTNAPQQTFAGFGMPTATITPSQSAFGLQSLTQTATSTSVPETWSFGQTLAKGGSAFGTTTTPSTNSNIFGSSSPIITSTQPLGFMQSPGETPFKLITTTTTSSGLPVFASSVTSSSTGPITSVPSFGTTSINPQGQTATSSPSFGQTTSIFGSGMAGFGQKPSGFNANPTTTGFSFGQPAVTTTSATFGQNTVFAFGSNASSGFAPAPFSNPATTDTVTAPTTQAPSFGGTGSFASSTQQQPFAGGFGQSPGSFGGSSSFGQVTPAFGHANPSTITATNSTFVFGKTTVASNEPFAFGSATTPSSSAFGSGTSLVPAFGSTAPVAAPSPFGSNAQQQPFGNSPATTSQPTAPSLFTFGGGNKSSTPGFNFSATATSEKPQNAPFAFGSGSGTPSSGFNFSASASSAGNAFSFGGAGSVAGPAFGQTATPSFGATVPAGGFSPFGQPSTPATFGTFSIGSGSTQPRSRAPSRRRGRP